MYELGSLKDQKLNKKHLQSTPEFKQHLLQPLHHLDVDFQNEILQKLIEEEISLKEMKTEAIHFRSLEAVKRAFLRCTNSISWRDACSKFPTFTEERRFNQFTTLDLRHGIPEAFKTYCQSALNYQAPSHGMVKTVKDARVAILIGSFESLSAQDVKDVDPSYSGAQLIFTDLPEVSHTNF